jgi:hypothetical protein
VASTRRLNIVLWTDNGSFVRPTRRVARAGYLGRMDTNLIKGLRAARLDRILDALAGQQPVADPRARRPRRRFSGGPKPPLTLHFLPTV